MGGYGSFRELYEFVFDYPLVNQQSHIKSTIFLSNFHQTCRFSMAMLVYLSVSFFWGCSRTPVTVTSGFPARFFLLISERELPNWHLHVFMFQKRI